MIERVLPVIKERWPNDVSDIFSIVIQQDNATPHLRPNNAEFLSTAQNLKVPVELCFQPAQSPDMNVLDLGLFTAIQSAQRKLPASNLPQLIDTVTEAFNSLPVRTIYHAFISLMA